MSKGIGLLGQSAINAAYTIGCAKEMASKKLEKKTSKMRIALQPDSVQSTVKSLKSSAKSMTILPSAIRQATSSAIRQPSITMRKHSDKVVDKCVKTVAKNTAKMLEKAPESAPRIQAAAKAFTEEAVSRFSVRGFISGSFEVARAIGKGVYEGLGHENARNLAVGAVAVATAAFFVL